MATSVTEPAPVRILVLDLNGSRGEELEQFLRRRGLDGRTAQAGAAALPAGDHFTVVVVCAPSLLPEVRATVARIEQSLSWGSLVLWAAHDPAALGEVFDAGFSLWLPAEAPASAVAAQVAILSGHPSPMPAAGRRDVLAVRAVTVDLERCEVAVAGQSVSLTPTEFRILAYLAARPGRVISNAELFREIHGFDASDTEAKDVIKVHIWRLRNKLTGAGADGDLIVNVRGFGYLLERRSATARAAAALHS